jgi:hypothetical protein
MRKEIDGMKKPFGTKANPARSCRDIYYAHPTFDDGIRIRILLINTNNFIDINDRLVLD